MRFPFATDALRFAAPLAVIAAVGAVAVAWWVALAPLLALAVVLFFFRDPHRAPPLGERMIVAAADGTVTEVNRNWPGDDFFSPGARVGIFLSVLNVHINRAPVAGEVESVRHTPGQFLNALRPESAARNENNLVCLRAGPHRVGVRQIAGTIARRIVCHCRPGDTLARGERFGLIRFGSRTEHLLPAGAELSVQVGDRVRAGETILGWLPPDPPASVGE